MHENRGVRYTLSKWTVNVKSNFLNKRIESNINQNDKTTFMERSTQSILPINFYISLKWLISHSEELLPYLVHILTRITFNKVEIN